MTGLLLGGAVVLAGAVVVTLMAVRRAVFVATVQGESMAPTLRTGDRLLVRRVPAAELRVGQVVVLDALAEGRPAGTLRRQGQYLIKRLAALPGDPTPRPLKRGTIAAGEPIPAGHVVVLGDNIALSYDSRQIGYLTTAQVRGVVFRVLANGRQRNIDLADRRVRERRNT